MSPSPPTRSPARTPRERFPSEPARRVPSPLARWFQHDKTVLVLALLIGGFFRFYTPLTSDFVVEDGGLFYLMAQQIRQHHFLLPATVPYSTATASIPFCYPPLAFYEAALLNALGLPLEIIFRFVPAIWATLSIYAVWKLARTVLEPLPEGRPVADLAALLWGLLPWTMLWMVMGGGMTRAPGLFMAFMGVEAGLRFWRNGEKNGPWVGLWLGLALLTHLERAHFLFIALVVVWLVYNHTWRGLGHLALILGLALLISAPWWGLCLYRFGLSPFLASYRSGSSSWSTGINWRHLYRTEFLFPLLGLVGYAGFLAWGRRYPFLPVWFAVILLTEVRSDLNFMLAPLMIAAALLICQFRAPWRPLAIGLFLCWGAFQAALLNAKYVVLRPSERQAMTWVSTHTPKTARFFVFPAGQGRDDWAFDLNAEWFPVLARRTGVLTVQGSEWLPHDRFRFQNQTYLALQHCASWRAVQQVARQRHIAFDYVFLPDQNHSLQTHFYCQMALELGADAHFERVYANSHVTVWRRKATRGLQDTGTKAR